MSKLIRAVWPSAIALSRSIWRASSAAGGPACWWSGFQGPRVSPVAAKRRSPSGS
jgi:hypothetical protein